MSAFNLSVNVADLAFTGVDEENDAVELQTVVGLMIPLGPQQAGVIGMGTVSYALNREMLEKLIEGANAALEALPAKPKLPKDFAIAGDMNQAKDFANKLQGLK